MTIRRAKERGVTTSPHCRAAVLTAVAACLLVAGCSGGGDPAAPSTSAGSSGSAAAASPSAAAPESPAAVPTVAQVFRAARNAALSAGSGRVTGTVRHEDETLDIDVEGAADGSNQTVFITTENGGTSEVIVLDGRYWLGGDEAFWAAQSGDPAAGRAMVGKYVSIDESAATELGSYSLRGVVAEFFQHPGVAALEGDASRAGTAEVEGRPAYVIGEERGARLWVAADGSGTLLRAIGPPGAPTNLVFSDWDRARTFTAPPASAVVEG
jgi:hypothetical protein